MVKNRTYRTARN